MAVGPLLKDWRRRRGLSQVDFERVASAVGEGSIAATQVYQYLQGQLPSP
jgi:transcriptional regulator with XRE-family HTH domain